MDENSRTKPVIKEILKSSMTEEHIYGLLDTHFTEYKNLINLHKRQEEDRLKNDQLRREQEKEYEQTIQDDLKKKMAKVDEANLEKALEQEKADRLRRGADG